MAVIVPILSTFNDKGIKSAVREFQTAKTKIQKFSAVGKVFEGVGRSLTKNVTVPLAAAAAGIFKATQAASSLEESLSKTNAVFGSSAQEIIAWSKSSATAFGASQQQALEAVSTYGNLFQAFGLTTTQAAEFSTNIVQLAGDLSSFNNVPIEEVFIALRSGLSGETEPLKRFGVALSDQRLRAEAAALGLGEYTGQLPVAIKSQAAYSLILKDTALAQGDYIRTSNSLANQQRTLQAEVQNIVAEFGTAFLPIMKQIIRIIRDSVVPQLQKFTYFIKGLSPDTLELAVKIAAVVAALGPFLIVLGKTIKGISTLITTVKLLSVAFFTNPIGVFTLLIVALGLVINKIVQRFGGWREVIRVVGNALIELVEKGLNAIIRGLNNVIDGINKGIEKLNSMGFNISELRSVSEVEFGRISKAAFKMTQRIDIMSDYALQLAGIGREKLKPALEDTGGGFDDGADKADKFKQALKELREAAVQAAQKVVDNLNKSLDDAKNKLSEAQGKFDDFKNSIKGTVTGILNFGEAADNADFLEGLVSQAADATEFADKVKKLIQLGLSERGIQQVLDAGYEAGSKIADQLIAGGKTIIDQVNELVASVDAVAEAVGILGADEFYSAGVRQGEALVNGILDTLRDAQAKLAAAQANAASGATIMGYEGLGARATGLYEQIQGITDPKAQKRALKDFASALEQSKGRPAISSGELKSITEKYRLAKGGIVLGPTNALIGEAGPEAVVPLTGSKAGVMGATYNITINAGIGTDGSVVGRQIVEAIKKYERSSGQVFARA